MTRIAKQEDLPRVRMTRIGKQEVMARVGRTRIVMHGRLPRGKSALDRELAIILVSLGVWLDIDSKRAGEASKIRLSLPIGLGISSPYELTTPGVHPPRRIRSEVHIATPDAQAIQSTEETPHDHPENFEGRKQRKGKGVMNEESREERDHARTHGVNSSDTYQRNRRRHRSNSSEDKSPHPRRELRSKRARRRRSKELGW
ncbi:hypothetical protein LWI29_010326 [Acer saccharum]|uniref:Uncharacterized protein n=1 Tax=Acer saccharum TaxID=4024 RepID=A0AA39SDK7_ACESA|nr:hypothetical protein LWI29_010326 [Acer saccharum]